MEIQQHDGMVVDVATLQQGFAELLRARERCCRGGGRRQRLCVCCPPSPPLFIGPLGWGEPAKTHLGLGGGGQGGGRGCLAPQGKGELPP